MPRAYTEDQLVEEPAIGLFAELGWATVTAAEGLFGAPVSGFSALERTSFSWPGNKRRGGVAGAIEGGVVPFESRAAARGLQCRAVGLFVSKPVCDRESVARSVQELAGMFSPQMSFYAWPVQLPPGVSEALWQFSGNQCDTRYARP